MKIVYAGTPEISATVLKDLCEKGHTIVAVLTQPDRPHGRGQKLQASPVKKTSQYYNVPVYQPETLRDPAIHELLKVFRRTFFLFLPTAL